MAAYYQVLSISIDSNHGNDINPLNTELNPICQ